LPSCDLLLDIVNPYTSGVLSVPILSILSRKPLRFAEEWFRMDCVLLRCLTLMTTSQLQIIYPNVHLSFARKKLGEEHRSPLVVARCFFMPLSKSFSMESTRVLLLQPGLATDIFWHIKKPIWTDSSLSYCLMSDERTTRLNIQLGSNVHLNELH
jgi:hypothetical protein